MAPAISEAPIHLMEGLDPLAWLAWGDWLEESGHPVTESDKEWNHALWRQRATLLSPLLRWIYRASGVKSKPVLLYMEEVRWFRMHLFAHYSRSGKRLCLSIEPELSPGLEPTAKIYLGEQEFSTRIDKLVRNSGRAFRWGANETKDLCRLWTLLPQEQQKVLESIRKRLFDLVDAWYALREEFDLVDAWYALREELASIKTGRLP